MKTLVGYKQPEKVFYDVEDKHVIIRKIEKYMHTVRKEIYKVSSSIGAGMEALTAILAKARGLNREVMLLGMNRDCHTVNHANVDFLKMNRLRVAYMGMPEMTAFGNDYAYPYHFKEILERRAFGHGNVLIGIQYGEISSLLEEAFQYNHINNGVNILIGNTLPDTNHIGLFIPVTAQDPLVWGDVIQLIFHYASAHLALLANPDFTDEGARTLQDYCGLLLQSLDSTDFLCEELADISMMLNEKICLGNAVYAFGNGGSAAIASYFADGMRDVLAGSGKACRNIIDVTSFVGDITESLHKGSYKNSVFTQLIKKLGVEEGDVLLGISSSGNSENIIHPFTEIPEAVRIGIVGFGSGGKIGRGIMKDMAFVVPDAGGYRSFQRAEDGQRIAVSCLLSSFASY